MTVFVDKKALCLFIYLIKRLKGYSQEAKR